MSHKYMTLEGGKKVLKPTSQITEFEVFNSDGEESTTSSVFVVKSLFPYTSDIKTVGSYVIDFTAEIGQTNANKPVSMKVEYRLGITGPWIELMNSQIFLTQPNAWQFVTSFRKNVSIVTPSVIQVQISWGMINAGGGGTGRIRFAGIKIGKIG